MHSPEGPSPAMIGVTGPLIEVGRCKLVVLLDEEIVDLAWSDGVDGRIDCCVELIP